MGIIFFIIGIILFIGLVVVHELGHALAARRNGVEVEEFGIGFPPRAWGKKLKNGTLFSLNWLPLGGFVKLKGEHDAADGPGTYGGANLWAKTKILLAGVLVNWATAIVIFSILAAVGMPKLVDNQFAVASDNHISQQKVLAVNVEKGTPAAKAGLQAGDQLKSLAGTTLTDAGQLSDLTKTHAGQTVPMLFVHQGQTHTVQVTLNKDNDGGKGYLGVGPGQQTTQRATWSAPIVGVGLTVQFTGLTFQGLGSAIANLWTGIADQFSHSQAVKQAGGAALNTAKNSVAGPVGIFSILWQSSDQGIVPVLMLIGVISLTLAVMNVLPIPALDGGRLFVTVLFRVLKKPLTKEREESIQAAGFLSLMALVVLITVLDVGRLIGK